MEVLKEFFWVNGEHFWGCNKKRKSHELLVALGRNRGGKFLVLTEKKGEEVKCIFALKGKEAGGWWRLLAMVAEVVRNIAHCHAEVEIFQTIRGMFCSTSYNRREI